MIPPRELILAILLALTGCHKKSPLPPTSLTSREQPVLTLQVKPDGLSGLTIPLAALIERGGITGVFVLQNHQARFRMIRIGNTAAGRVVVLSGLHGDETLVLGELAGVHDSTPITAVDK
ncbi:MAG: hypothetical protein ACYC9J_00190 [Sulfuricaulis sp.]